MNLVIEEKELKHLPITADPEIMSAGVYKERACQLCADE